MLLSQQHKKLESCMPQAKIKKYIFQVYKYSVGYSLCVTFNELTMLLFSSFNEVNSFASSKVCHCFAHVPVYLFVCSKCSQLL